MNWHWEALKNSRKNSGVLKSKPQNVDFICPSAKCLFQPQLLNPVYFNPNCWILPRHTKRFIKTHFKPHKHINQIFPKYLIYYWLTRLSIYNGKSKCNNKTKSTLKGSTYSSWIMLTTLSSLILNMFIHTSLQLPYVHPERKINVITILLVKYTLKKKINAITFTN